MNPPLFVRFDVTIAIAYAAIVAALVFVYRRARSPGTRLLIYLLSLVLVLTFLLLFAPR